MALSNYHIEFGSIVGMRTVCDPAKLRQGQSGVLLCISVESRLRQNIHIRTETLRYTRIPVSCFET